MKAEYIDHMGDDLTVVNAARVSMDKHHEEWQEMDDGLIGYLAKHNHWTPFSHPQIMMRETVPIFVARQRFKSTVGFTYNEISRRYVDDKPEFFRPDVWRNRPQGSIKQGSDGFNLNQFHWNSTYENLLEISERLYNDMIEDGVAPEQARMVLPQSMYTSYYVTGSLSAWARAYRLRTDDHSQKEIQNLVRQWGYIIRNIFPKSWKELTDV